VLWFIADIYAGSCAGRYFDLMAFKKRPSRSWGWFHMAWRFLSSPPSTHEQGWWPTPRWALRRLAMYAIAALSGGVLLCFVPLYSSSLRLPDDYAANLYL